MRERGIIFSAPMVRALLDGRKTQTRRIAQRICPVEHVPTGRCPYGVPGDRLWVREAFRLRADQDGVSPSQDWWKSGAWHEATGPEVDGGGWIPSGCGGGAGKLRPAIHMPRWASRITLELTDVRVERLQSMSEEDAIAEGIDEYIMSDACPARSLSNGMYRRFAFEHLWDSLNRKRAPWESNPWVWVLSFRVIEPPRTTEGR